MKIKITKVYNVNIDFLSYVLNNFDKLPNDISKFEESLSEMLSNCCEDYEYYENVEELYRKIKSILM